MRNNCYNVQLMTKIPSKPEARSRNKHYKIRNEGIESILTLTSFISSSGVGGEEKKTTKNKVHNSNLINKANKDKAPAREPPQTLNHPVNYQVKGQGIITALQFFSHMLSSLNKTCWSDRQPLNY